MTEDEAKTKWCPFVRYIGAFSDSRGVTVSAASYNRGALDGGLQNAACLGSGCMMWRELKHAENYTGIEQGWCGLGGKP